MIGELHLAMQKRLNKSEMNSLISSIKQCTNFNQDAKIFIEANKLQKSVVYQYAKVLKNLGYPVKIFRETERYRFMLALSLQQTWDDIGPIFKKTKFIDLKGHKKNMPTHRIDNLYEYCYDCVINGKNKEDIANLIKNTEEQEIRHVAIYQDGNNVIIVSFIKPSNIYKVHNVYYRLNQTQLPEPETPVNKPKVIQIQPPSSVTKVIKPIILFTPRPQIRAPLQL